MKTQDVEQLESAMIINEAILLGGHRTHDKDSFITKIGEWKIANWWKKLGRVSSWTCLAYRSVVLINVLVLRLAVAAPQTSNTTVLGSQTHVQIQFGLKKENHNGLDIWNRSLDQQMEEVIPDEVSKVNVYVYDDPALDFSDLIDCYREKYGESPWQHEHADMAQDMGEIWLHRAMLEHPWRVLEPDKAVIFYVPIYPVLSFKLLGRNKHKCSGLTHHERMKNAVDYLNIKSVYFNRFGGGDHMVVFAWWNCHSAFDPSQRMLLRRAVLAINERNQRWANWGCDGRLITIPYTSSSVISTPELFGGYDLEDRDIPFFFVGTVRNRPERRNLKVAEELYPASVIRLGDNMRKWGMNATQYAHHIIRSKFCFNPRGDTLTSRRIFDAIAAGCIPVLVSPQVAFMPFSDHGLDYNEFAVIAPEEGFGSREDVIAVIEDIASRSEEKVQALQRGVRKAARTLMVYGLNEGPNFGDMRPFLGSATRILSETLSLGGGANLWKCGARHLDTQKLSPRTWINFPPPESSRKRWLSQSETIINAERSLLFCAPPNAGSLQFRMLAKRMEGVTHWAISDDRDLLFDPSASELSLLDVENTTLMNSIYKDNGGGWIKIGVVRDPVTRLVSAYLDYVHAAKSTRASSYGGERRRGLGDEDLDWFKGVFSERSRSRRRAVEEEEFFEHGIVTRDASTSNTPGSNVGRTRLMGDVQLGLRFGKGVGKESNEAVEIIRPTIPTFADLVTALEASMDTVPTAFRPISGLCGMEYSPFDSVIPFETLQKTSSEVLKSLPRDVWGEYGTSGWGPNGDQAFMEFDHGSVLRQGTSRDKGASGGVEKASGAFENNKQQQVSSSSSLPSRARYLFEAGSCDWTTYYPDEGTLQRVAALYSSDYDLFGWYHLDPWVKRLRSCLDENR